MSSFQEAVDFVAEQMRPFVINGQIEVGEDTRDRLALELHLGVYYVAETESSAADFVVSDEAAQILLDCCEETVGSYNLLCDICALKISGGRRLPEAAKTFAALHLMGRLKKPKSEKGAKTWERNQMLIYLADMCCWYFGLKPTRVDQKKGAHESACDAVSQGLARAGHSISPRAIKELLVGADAAEHRKAYKDFADMGRTIARQRPDIAAGWHRMALRKNWNPFSEKPYRNMTDEG